MAHILDVPLLRLPIGEFALAWEAMDYRFAVIVRRSGQHRSKAALERSAAEEGSSVPP